MRRELSLLVNDAPIGDWAERAACLALLHELYDMGFSLVEAQRDVWAVFYPDRPRGSPTSDYYEQARRICAACPVVADCLNHAVESGDVAGFRAGRTPDQLETHLKTLRRGRGGLLRGR